MENEIGAAGHLVPARLWERQAWLGAAALESVTELNEQVLELLQAQSLVGGQTALTQQIGDRLRSLDLRGRQRLAACGVLLVDVGFGLPGFWAAPSVDAVHDREHFVPAAFFTVDGTVTLMRQVITHAWHLARSQPTAGCLLLGMSPANSQAIGAGTLNRLTRLADTRTPWLRPRWDNRAAIWLDLLRMAAATQPGSLERMRVRVLQLLAADAWQG